MFKLRLLLAIIFILQLVMRGEKDRKNNDSFEKMMKRKK